MPLMSNKPTSVVNGKSDNLERARDFKELRQIGQRIAAMRKQRGATQDEMAAAIGIARGTLGSIETGIDRAGVLTTVAIADFLSVSVDWLLGRNQPVDGPFPPEVLNHPDEIALVRFWRRLSDEQKVIVLDQMRPPGKAKGR